RRLRGHAEDIVFRSEIAYRFYLGLKFGSSDAGGELATRNENCALQSTPQWQEDCSRMRRLGFVVHPDGPKNWDTLTALSAVLSRTDPDASILDAGAELYSPVLPTLFLAGYRNLYGINVQFKSTLHRGPIAYE